MPTDYTILTTTQLKNILLDPAKAQEHAAVVAELICEEREIEETHPEEELRGGIRPRRPNI